jgi:starch phosphorylase
VRATLGLELPPELLFDVQVKRIHEYKRQLLNVLHALALYHRIRDGEQTLPRAVIVAGKAAPGYAMAKLIIKLVHAVAALVEADPLVRARLRVVFLPNYSVSLAERIFPACELSQQISTAGTEASGTGNMKAALNGALTIGTLDGANVEIQEEVGAENIFIFGHTADQIEALRRQGFDSRAAIESHPELRRVVATLASLGPLFDPIVEGLVAQDRYFHCADFPAYLQAQRAAEQFYAQPREWARRSILNVAGMGKFSSDRTVAEYAREIWRVEPPE